MTFTEFWNRLLFQPKSFFENDFNNKESPYFGFVIAIFGVASALGRIDKQFMKYDLKGQLDQIAFLNNWSAYWLFAIFGGFIAGISFYYLGGWFYNLRVKWAKGVPDKATSRFIFLYSSFIPALPTVLYAIQQTIRYEQPYMPESNISLSESAVTLLIIVLMYYSVYVSYRGVTIVMKPSKWPGRIWFLILPCIMYSFALIAIIAAFIFAG